MYADIPAVLRSADYARLSFDLEFQEACTLGLDAILRLRRDLHKVGRQVLGEGEEFSALFDPPLPTDPDVRRRHQRPGPPFVLYPPAALPETFDTGDVLTLSAVFVGEGIQRLPDFIRVLHRLGSQGVHRGEGRFEVAAVRGTDASGTVHPLWCPGESLDRITPPILEMLWWLQSAFPPGSAVLFEFLTPARLLTGGRPLFRGTFSRIFPFLLRRVTSVLSSCCALQVVEDPAPLLEAAVRVREGENRLAWEDWRVLEGPEHRLDFGGLVGSLRLEGDALPTVLWVLGLASLLNVGRGAAYGAGHLRLRALF